MHVLVADVPDKVKEAIQDVELCLQKARTYQHSDGVVCCLLCGHAAGELYLPIHAQPSGADAGLFQGGG